MRRESFSRAAERVALAGGGEPVGDRPSHMCAEPGCPMYGTISDAPGGTRRYCRFHYGIFGEEAARVTATLRARRDLVEEVHRLRRASAYGGDGTDADAGRQARAVDAELAAAVKGGGRG